MNSPIIFGLLFLQGVYTASHCSPGFSLNDDGFCYKMYSNSYIRNEASRNCAQASANLASITSAYANSKMQHFAQQAKSIWLGITCLTNDISFCMFDDGTPFTKSSFSNFKGPLNISQGSCVYMDTYNGYWFNSDCSSSLRPFVCSYNLEKPAPTCTPDSSIFQGNCYFPIPVDDIDHAVDTCRSHCGDVASIHYEAEDIYVGDLAESFDHSEKYMLIGLEFVANSTYNWTDGSPYNYKNFGFENIFLGTCVAMALVDDAVPKGKWVNSACSVKGLVSVCKKPLNNPCDTTTPRPTLAPTVCSSPQYLQGAGLVYSPGYPLASPPNTCEYIITGGNAKPYLDLTSVNLDWNSVIQIYDYFLDANPAVTYTNINFNQKIYNSNSNVMKLVFKTSADTYINNYWQAGYGIQTSPTVGPTPPFCNGGEFDSYGNITSPHYPNVYDNFEDCAYYLKTMSNRIELKFNVVDLAVGDKVTLYDGYGYDSAVITTVTGTTPPRGNFTSVGRWMTVRLTTGKSTDKFGFHASFWSI